MAKDSKKGGGSANLIPVRSEEEAREKGRKGGIKSGETRRRKKTLREMTKFLMESDVSKNMKSVRATLENMGLPDDEMTYSTAVAVRLLQKGMIEGDTSSIRLIGELTGDIGFSSLLDDGDIVDMVYPTIMIPDNGRDKRTGNEIAPQAGPQTMFMASSADIVIYGGAAGGGKSYAIVMEPLRHKDVPGFNGILFRQNNTQLEAPGGLWETAQEIYDRVPGSEPRKSPKLRYNFSGGGSVTFDHLDGEVDLKKWQGSQMTYIAFDELTHFTKHQFFYMLARNRSTCGIKPYVRATCNPDADSWVADFIAWWINQDTGYPIPERSGIIRWMVVIADTIHWGDSREEMVKFAIEQGVEEEQANEMPKSVTFIASNVRDNKKLLEANPGYISNLLALAEVDKERLLNGNWKIKPAAGRYFRRSQVEIIEQMPNDIIAYCRAWDLAATDEDENGDADCTSGVLMGKRAVGTFVVLHVINERLKAGDVEKLVLNTSKADYAKYGYAYTIHLPQDPGQAGKAQAKQYTSLLAGFNIKTAPVSGSKELRASPFAAQWQNGFVQLMSGEWNDMYLTQMESFPESKHDDMVDATSDAFDELTDDNFNIENLL